VRVSLKTLRVLYLDNSIPSPNFVQNVAPQLSACEISQNESSAFLDHPNFQGRSPDQQLAAAAAFGNNGGGRPAADGGQAAAAGLPSLKPDEKAGRCEKYIGSACAKVFGGGDAYVFVSTDQTYVEKKLAATFVVMATSPDMSARCAEFAIPAICHSTFPLCDGRTRRPRKLCRDECEVLELDICRAELAIAKSHPMIGT
jgi:hypothetical protein